MQLEQQKLAWGHTRSINSALQYSPMSINKYCALTKGIPGTGIISGRESADTFFFFIVISVDSSELQYSIVFSSVCRQWQMSLLFYQDSLLIVVRHFWWTKIKKIGWHNFWIWINLFNKLIINSYSNQLTDKWECCSFGKSSKGSLIGRQIKTVGKSNFQSQSPSGLLEHIGLILIDKFLCKRTRNFHCVLCDSTHMSRQFERMLLKKVFHKLMKIFWLFICDLSLITTFENSRKDWLHIFKMFQKHFQCFMASGKHIRQCLHTYIRIDIKVVRPRLFSFGLGLSFSVYCSWKHVITTLNCTKYGNIFKLWV